MYTANVYNIFIASPSDVVTERDNVEAILYEWNRLNSYKRGIILQPVRWKKDVYSDFSDVPQEIINRQILERADILVAVFYSKIGSPTKDYEGGTVEELKTHIRANRPALVFFSGEPIERNNINPDQLEALGSFKEWCKTHGVYFEYNSKEEFKELIRNQIYLMANGLSEYSVTSYPTNDTYSRLKQDALDFISKIPSFQKNVDLMKQYFDDMGNYRSSQLNPFLEKTGTVKIIITTNGMFRLQIGYQFNGFKQSDVDFIIQDIKDGKYDEYLQ